uniref:ARAD1C20240p n=1 Tax=Blastobotrys adeninivorans TaxID=409370 RepID=A0A060T6I0_BLAAD
MKRFGSARLGTGPAGRLDCTLWNSRQFSHSTSCLSSGRRRRLRGRDAELAGRIREDQMKVRQMLANLFSPSKNASDVLSRYYRQQNLYQLSKQVTPELKTEELMTLHKRVKPSLYDSAVPPLSKCNSEYTGTEKAPASQSVPKSSNDSAQQFINQNPLATTALYLNTAGISFSKSDLERLLPPRHLMMGSYSSDIDPSFELVRSRSPANLVRWFGYYLIFKSREAAVMYYQETLGAELCGLEVKLQFVEPTAKGIHSPILDQVPGVSRSMCALMIGLPANYTRIQIMRKLWDYDFIDDDNFSVQKLPMGRVRYGGPPVLLRFKSEEEAQRLVREFDRRLFPGTENEVYVEVLD